MEVQVALIFGGLILNSQHICGHPLISQFVSLGTRNVQERHNQKKGFGIETVSKLKKGCHCPNNFKMIKVIHQ